MTTCRTTIDGTPLFLQPTCLAAIPWLRHATTTRLFARPESDRLSDIRRLQAELGVPGKPVVYAQQRHTGKVREIDQSVLDCLDGNGRYVFEETDAIVSPVPGVTIAVFTADCVPVCIVDEQTRAIAVVHAGWKGTLSRIAEAAIDAMCRLGSSPANLTAWIGPSIGGCCYEVDLNLISRFIDEFPEFRNNGHRFHEGRMLDLAALNELQLRTSGIPASRVHRSGICTLHERGVFYTYRGEGPRAGRLISALTVVC